MASSHESAGESNEPIQNEPNNSELEQKINSMQTRIDATFSELIELLNQRWMHISGEFRELKDAVLYKASEQANMEKRSKELSEILDTNIKENMFSEIITKTRKEMESQMIELANTPVTFDYDFKINNLGQFKDMISKFGSLQSTNIDYSQIKTPKVCFGKIGEGAIVSPRALAVDSEERIFIADTKRRSIHVYSSSDGFLKEFGRDFLAFPWGVCCGEDKLFVTDHRLHSVFSFNLSSFVLIRKVCSIGSHDRELNSPTSINFDAKEKELYVADYLNNRIAIFDTDLNFRRYLLENSVEGPICVNVTEKRIFILECRSPNFRSYAKDGSDPRSHYSIGKKEVIKSMLFFCVDNRNNLILSDFVNNCIRVISYRGEVVKSIGNDRMLQPTGICLSQAGDALIVVTHQKHYPIHLY